MCWPTLAAADVRISGRNDRKASIAFWRTMSGFVSSLDTLIRNLVIST
jgi:hypothetical protein